MSPKQTEETAIENIKAQHGTVFDSFTNEHGEKFIMYSINNSPVLFVTGTEFDWNLDGYFFDPNSKGFIKVFITSSDESDKALNIHKTYTNSLKKWKIT